MTMIVIIIYSKHHFITLFRMLFDTFLESIFSKLSTIHLIIVINQYIHTLTFLSIDY